MKSSPFKDKFGNEIKEGDICRSWHIDKLHVKKGFWLFEEVKLVNGIWLLYEQGLDYDTIDDKPHLLAEYYMDLEVIN